MKTRTPTRRAAVIVAFALYIALALAGFAPSQGEAKNSSSLSPQSSTLRARRVIVISLDGLDARYLSRADEFGLRIPALRRLMATGVTARGGVVSVYPSLTYPAHTTLVTGARPLRHGIFGNEVFDPADPQSRRGLWFARAIRAETLWERTRGPRSSPPRSPRATASCTRTSTPTSRTTCGRASPSTSSARSVRA
ncbi:MAG: alkaline phosphatase family protein [Acidobacteria bacterium]|nr:alkaline phosphatase family protein [Acidobacteriota bacterium]